METLPNDLKPSRLTTLSHGNAVAFFTQHSVFLNHYRGSFKQDGLVFTSREQFLMLKKAKYFHDEATAQATVKTNDAADAKELGRRVQNFNQEAWRTVRDNYMRTALTAKFTKS